MIMIEIHYAAAQPYYIITGEPTYTTSKQWHNMHPSYDTLLPAMYSPLHSSKNQLKITSAIKVAPTKITEDFSYKWKPPCAYNKINGEHRMQTRALVSS